MMTEESNNSKRIAKNTFYLFIRMVLILGISLYTSRVILNALGVDDFGLYNIVAGFISILSFLTGSLSGTTSRYITFALGKGDKLYLYKVFSNTLITHLFLCLIILLFGETIGLWFVTNKLTIPIEKINVAVWVYQISILTTILSVLKIPYNALIIAHEEMKTFAYISIIETIAKLIIAFSITYSPVNKLILYAFLILIVQMVITSVYYYYCKQNYRESKAQLIADRTLLKEISSYSSWCILGYGSIAANTQGLNILLNMFYGTTANAARGIAVQVQNATAQLCGNFQMALNPQITKNYANGNYKYMHSLITTSSKFSFFLMLIMITPILLNCEYILNLWLITPPKYTIEFTKIILIISTIETLKNPILAAIHATGNIKKIQTIDGICLLSILPISYITLKLYHPEPTIIFLIYLIIECITQIIRIKIIAPRIGLAIKNYVRNGIYPILKVSIVIILPYFLVSPKPTFIFLILSTFLYTIFNIITIFILGLKTNERIIAIQKTKSLIKKIS